MRADSVIHERRTPGRSGQAGLLLLLLSLATAPQLTGQPLASLEYRIVGTALRVNPVALSVPKGIAGSVLVQLLTGADTNSAGGSSLLSSGTFVEATLRGPSFPARRIVGQVNQPLLLPALNLVGDYQLDRIRLVDSTTGETRMDANPSSVPVHVFDEVLISRVTSRPLTLQEIQDKGIVIDQANFRAVEFEVGFVLDGKSIPVRFPVIAPTFNASTEIIPQAELEAKLAEAKLLNQQIAGTVELPPELEQSQLNIQIQGINFQPAEVGSSDLKLSIPPIPALMVIPGNIGFLNQFFSVQIFTENGAPQNSGLSVNNIQAQLTLPAGPDHLASTNYNQPGDDPLRFARVGPNKIIAPVQPVARPGTDGQIGTADDVTRLTPGESGQGEFLVEGLQEGLHVMEIDLTADLEGLAAGVVKVKGKAAGSVLVRNPKFSVAFTHPRTVRADEPYDASVTILNTSISPANLVRVSLPSTALSGGVLRSPETVELGTIMPGQSATATFRIRPQRTGSVSFSNLTTSDESTEGRFRFSMGIDERGVVLSPDTLAVPDFVNSLPTNLVQAANRVLGQALSVATAGQLPPGVLSIPKSIITKRVLELAEAGQRLKYGDELNHVLVDLLLDWQGGRTSNPGFDQILRTTDAGREFRETLSAEQEKADALDGIARLVLLAPDLVGRGEAWAVAAANVPGILVILHDATNSATLDHSEIAGALGYGATRGAWLVANTAVAGGTFRWTVTNTLPSADFAAVFIDTNGSARVLRWTVPNPSPGSCYSLGIHDSSGALAVDANCDGTPETSLRAVIQDVSESPPRLVSVIQDPGVQAGRPTIPCSTLPYDPRNYGTVLAVLFSKPMTQNGVNLPSAYRLENGNQANSVQIQPGARVALLNMARPVGAIRPRQMTVSGVSDPRGHPMILNTRAVQSDLRAGTAVRGRVVRADGSVAAAVPVTLTYYDLDGSGFDCVSFIVRASQVFTDQDGLFDFDFVVSGIPYSVSATDTAGMPPEAIQLVLESASGDSFAQAKLLELLNAQTNQAALVNAFGGVTVPQAIALAEGLDRALLRDLVPVHSAREGTETVVALRFRGRGAVTGQVLAADGVTSVSGVAVNLFPDPDSRELGRGVLSDGSGQFGFFGVPLGVFTVQAQAPNGQFRTVAGVLDTVGQTNVLKIILATNIFQVATLRGRVFEPDGITPHAGARIFAGHFDELGRLVNVVATATSDPTGFWVMTNFPGGTYDLGAVSFDGLRKGDRRGIQTSLALDTQVAITLNGRTTVSGRVEFFNGLPATNALVAGGDTLVRTDSQGLFTLTGVPTGQRTISAGLEKNPAAGIDFTRLGSASLNVIAGVDNFVVVRLRPAGRITGRVLDALGSPVPNVRVAIPQENGFIYVDADAQGNYVFDNLALGDYTLSAPAPSTAKTDTSGLVDKIREGSSDEIQAALGEAFRIFAGLTDPFLNGEPFNPSTWGFTRTQLTLDGKTVVADILELRPGTVTGTVLNGQGVPIGAKVRLTGLGPLANGQPSFVIRGEMNSDPSLGTFGFTNSLLAGPFGIQVASPFYPVVISTNGQTTSTEPNATGLVLRFPRTAETQGRLTGIVSYPDGTPVGSNVSVKISFGPDFVIHTDTNGVYDTLSPLLPATDSEGRPGAGYSIEAQDPLTGLRGSALAIVLPGVTNVANVQLLGKGGLNLLVRQADGAPATSASVEVTGGSYPNERFTGTADPNGAVSFLNLFAGPYAVRASFITGLTTVFGRASVVVAGGSTSSVSVVLGPTATVRGTFVQRDLTAPVAFAQVAIGDIGFATTDAQGKFEIAGIPLGRYRLTSQDPVTGIGAIAEITLAVQGEVREVTLIEQARGELNGSVLDGYGVSLVPGAIVIWRVAGGLTPPRTVSTGPDGHFSFPGTPAGDFTLEAEDPVRHFKGFTSGSLLASVPVLTTQVQLQQLARLAGRIFEPDGITPATNAAVLLVGPAGTISTDTDAAGRVAFLDLPLGGYTLRADSLRANATHSAIKTNLSLSVPGNAPDLAIRLAGVGTVSGTVFLSDGTTPAADAEVTINMQAPLFNPHEETTFASGTGLFTFTNVALGPYTLSAKSVALGTSVGGSLSTDGEIDNLTLVLGASGAVVGRLLRADGLTPVSAVDVSLQFNSQSGLPGIAVARTDPAGAFAFANIPVGSFDFAAIAPAFGIARFSSRISANGQTNNLGDVRLDEDDPRVVSVTPLNASADVPISTAVTLIFNEPLSTNSLNTNGIFLRTETGVVRADLRLLADPTNGQFRVVQIIPLAPLRSQKTYQAVVLDGTRLDATANLIASGPTDLVGRPLTAPFISTFSTADNDPPLLVSQFPANGDIMIDPRAVLRLAFNEPIQATNFTFTLTGPAGAVPGTAAVGLNGLVLTFTPTAELAVNGTFSLAVNEVRDLPGNLATNQPITGTFATLDTLGPGIATLRLATNQAPVAGATVQIEAVLGTNELGASVRFTQDFNPAGADDSPPFTLSAKLPATGSTTFRAIATDRFGNDGPFAELTLTVQSNQPPVIALARGTPATGSLTNGQPFSISVSANDDVSVTNITLVGLGAVPLSTNLTGVTSLILNLTVPLDAVPAGLFQFRAQATDSLGVRSPEAVLDLQLTDRLPPTITILSPAPNAVLNVSRPLQLVVTSSDNAGNHQLQAVADGAINATQTLALISAPGVPVTNTFNFSLAGVVTDGSSITVSVFALDQASNSISATRTFQVQDSRSPLLLSFVPTNSATRQSVWLDAVVFDFDEALNPFSVTNQVRLTNNVGTPASFTVALANANRQLRVTLSHPLQPGAIYTNVLLPGLTDTATNAWRNTGGQPVPPEGIPFVFSTANILASNPTNGTRVIAGQAVTVVANYEAGLGAKFFRFQLNSNSPVQVPAGLASTGTTLTIPTNATDAVIRITASPDATFTEPFVFPSVALMVLPLAGDLDTDGMPNAYEIAAGLDPFVNDAALDPDSDGLSNLAEFQGGTNPRDPDTDHDGLSDGVEVATGCANPLNPDSDGDGLIDGIDPNPCSAAAGLTFTGPASLSLLEGSTTNLLIQVASSNSPIALLDYSPTNLPPAFVSVKSRTSINTPTNGVATIELELNPLHDAAGEHRFSLRAASTSGDSGVFNIQLTVLNNPALTATRWNAAINGNWSDPTKWSDGVPGPGKVAVIDAVGAYTVTFDATISGAGVVLDHTNAVLLSPSSLTVNAPFELRHGRFDILSSQSLVLNRPLVNRDTLHWVSRNHTFDLGGNGRVENLGLWEIFADPANPTGGAESNVRVPVNVPVGGKLRLNSGFVNFTSGSSLTVGGELAIEEGGRLRVDGTNPPRDITLQSGSVLSGTGTLRLDGSNRLLVPGDLDTTVAIVLNGSSTRLVVPGTYTIRGSGSVVGTIQAQAIIVKSNAVVSASSASFTGLVTVENGATLQTAGGTVSFGSNVLVAAGATWELPQNTTVSLNGVLTNLGTLHWVSRNHTFDLGGNGRVENLGLWEIFADPANPTGGAESNVRVPVNVPVGGKLRLNSGFVNFTSGSSLTVGGELAIEEGGRLRVDGTNPPRDITLQSGSVLSGTGTLQLDGNNRIALLSDVTSGMGLISLTGSSSISGTATLTVGPGSTLRYDHSSTLPGNLTINGTLLVANSSTTLSIEGILTLNAGGTIDNSAAGVIPVGPGKFVNNGGTIVGNPPVISGPGLKTLLPALRIVRMTFVEGTAPHLAGRKEHPVNSRRMTLECLGASGQPVVVETSTDLRGWSATSADVQETQPGRYRATLTIIGNGPIFFRVSQKQPLWVPENPSGQKMQP